jgi:hypothetical protein
MSVKSDSPARLMRLAKDYLLVRTVESTPGTNAALQGTPDASGQIGMAPLHLFEDGNRAQLRRRLEHRHDLGLEEIGQRVRAAAATDLLIGRQPVIVLEAIRGGRAD